MNTAEKYWWVYNHPKLNQFDGWSPWIDVEPHMVCKETNRVEDDRSKNTTLQLWIEVMYYVVDEMVVDQSEITKNFIPMRNNMTYCHDWQLDCGGFTFEEAIDDLYELVLEHYGDYERLT